MPKPADQDPYRVADDPPLATYAIRSSGLFAAVLGFCLLFAITSVWFGLAHGVWSGRLSRVLPTALLTAVGPLAFVSMFASRDTYLVRGGKATIKMFRDRVEISDGAGSHWIDVASMRSDQIRHRARIFIGFIPVATHETDRHIRMSSPGRTFQLSRRLFASHQEFERFCADVDALLCGEEPGRPERSAPVPLGAAADPSDPDAEYRRRLAYELGHVGDEDDD